MRISRSIASVTTAVLMLFMAACATPPDQLTQARNQYEKAKESHADEYAPVELQEAGKWLDKASMAYEEDADEQVVKTLAYVAERASQQAMVRADLFLAKERKLKNEQEIARLQAERENQLVGQRDRLLQALAQRETLMRMTAQELARTQSQLAMMRDQLASAREQGSMTVVEIEREVGRLDKLSSLLEQERQARMAAEKDLAAKQAEIARLQEELKGIATVEQGRDRTVITLDDQVLFEFDKAALIPTARQKLNRLAELLSETQGQKIVVEGHTDAIGSETYNEKLSKERAHSVAQFLTNRGIGEDRINAVGAGEQRPVASNETPEGRAMNRRVEIVLMDDEAMIVPNDSDLEPSDAPGDSTPTISPANPSE